MKGSVTSAKIAILAMMLVIVSCQTNWFINPPPSTSVCAEYRIENQGSGNCPSSSTYTVCVSCKTCKASPYIGLTASPQTQRRIKTDNTWESTPTEQQLDNDHWMCFSTNVEEYDTPGASESLCLTVTKSWKSALCTGASCPYKICKSCYQGTTLQQTGKTETQRQALNFQNQDNDAYLCTPTNVNSYETPASSGSMCLAFQKDFTCNNNAECYTKKCNRCINSLTPNANGKKPSQINSLSAKEIDSDAWMCYPSSSVPDKIEPPGLTNSVCTTYTKDYNAVTCPANTPCVVCKTCKNGSTPTGVKASNAISSLTMIEKMNDRWMCSYTETAYNSNSVCTTYLLDYITAACSVDASRYCISCSACKSGTANAAKKGTELLTLTTAQRDNDAWMCTSSPNTNTNTNSGFTIILDTANSSRILFSALQLLAIAVVMCT